VRKVEVSIGQKMLNVYLQKGF